MRVARHTQVLLGNLQAIELAQLSMSVHFERLEHRQQTINKKQQMDEQLQRRQAGVIGEIEVPADYMGMAIGKQGSNIKAAQALPGAVVLRPSGRVLRRVNDY